MLKTMQSIPNNTNVWAVLHVIQKGKSKQPKRPLFFFHGDWMEGPPLYCVALSRSLGPSQPFYALDSYKFDGPRKPTTLEELAASYLPALRAVQPEGPYLLGGFCSGAFLAYEIAHQLQEQRQKVDLLVLISPSKVTDSNRRARRAIGLVSTLFHISRAKQLHCFLYIRHMLRHIYRKILPPTSVKVKGFSKVVAYEPRLNVMFPPVEALYHDFTGVFVGLAAGYKIRYSLENTVFIWAGDDNAFRPKWQVAEKNNRSVSLPGPYLELMNENLGLFAEQLKIFVDEVQTEE